MRLTPDHRRLLMAILARIDAVHEPGRYYRDRWQHFSAWSERVAMYHHTGLPMAGGGSAAGRKSHERDLGTLCRAGLIVIRGRIGRAVAVRLTEFGHCHARALAPTGQALEHWPLLEAAVAFADYAHQRRAPGCLEHWLLRRDDEPTLANLERIADLLLPFLTRGWLRSWSDTESRVFYTVTDGGRAALAGKPPRFTGLPEYIPADTPDSPAAEYFAAWEEAMDERDTWDNETRVIAIPVGAGFWCKSPREAAGGDYAE